MRLFIMRKVILKSSQNFEQKKNQKDSCSETIKYEKN